MRSSPFAVVVAAGLVGACGLDIVGIDLSPPAEDAGLDAGSPTTTPRPDASPVVDGVDAAPSVVLTPVTAVIQASDTLDFTGDGTLDWMFFGLSPAARKAGANLITGYTASADPAARTIPNGGNSCTWSDGAAPVTATTSALAMFEAAPVDLSFTMPSSTTTRTVTLYLGGTSSTMSVEADLDGQTMTTPVNADPGVAGYRVRYTLSFSSSLGGTLTLKLRLLSCGAGKCDDAHFFAFDGIALK